MYFLQATEGLFDIRLLSQKALYRVLFRGGGHPQWSNLQAWFDETGVSFFVPLGGALIKVSQWRRITHHVQAYWRLHSLHACRKVLSSKTVLFVASLYRSWTRMNTVFFAYSVSWVALWTTQQKEFYGVLVCGGNSPLKRFHSLSPCLK